MTSFQGATMSLRRIAAAGIGVTLLVTLAACTSKSGGTGALSGVPGASTSASAGASAPAPESPSPVPAVTVTVTPSAPTTTAPAKPAYPADYFAAILAAWKAHNTSYLTLLTSAATTAQLYGYGNINQTWHSLGTDGAMGTNYGTYYNNGGDQITLRSVNQETSAKHWHAASVENWDKMTFPTNPVAYVKRFVDGWIAGNKARMTLLSNATMTAQILAITPVPGTYTVGSAPGGGTAGHSHVEIKDPAASLDITLAVVSINPGAEHEIDNCDSGC
jgi:hypothetical protein